MNVAMLACGISADIKPPLLIVVPSSASLSAGFGLVMFTWRRRSPNQRALRRFQVARWIVGREAQPKGHPTNPGSGGGDPSTEF